MGVTMIFQHNIIMMEDAYNNQQKNGCNQQTTVFTVACDDLDLSTFWQRK